MKHFCILGFAAFGFAAAANAAPSPLTVTVDGVRANQPVPAEQALCLPTGDGKSDKTGKNMRPTISWSGAPEGTHSFAVFMMDPDVPADFTDAGKEGKVIAASAQRQDFFHYGVINIPAKATGLAGSASGKKPENGEELTNDLGLNKYVTPAHRFGGPCPPWNDARLHHYHFIVLALSKDAQLTAPADKDCSKPDCEPTTARNTYNRLKDSGHVLARGKMVGTYTLNPGLRE